MGGENVCVCVCVCVCVYTFFCNYQIFNRIFCGNIYITTPETGVIYYIVLVHYQKFITIIPQK